MARLKSWLLSARQTCLWLLNVWLAFVAVVCMLIGFAFLTIAATINERMGR